MGKLPNSYFLGERLDAINIFRARKLSRWLFVLRMYYDGVDHYKERD